jgi:hypothetical protein
MMAVLSLHAYDQNADGAQIGNATILRAAPQEFGFAAYAYSYNGGTVISFRGTDGIIPDVWYGYGTGAGLQSTQASLAANFYRTVEGAGFPYGTSVTFTGHSLGGGLAGLLASLYGKQAVVFDEMAYSAATGYIHGNAIHPWVIDPVTGVEVVGEANPVHRRVLEPNSSNIGGWQLRGSCWLARRAAHRLLAKASLSA